MELQLLARRDHTLALVICPYLHFEHFTSAASEDYFLAVNPLTIIMGTVAISTITPPLSRSRPHSPFLCLLSLLVL